jgi:hypothetical protein
VNLTNPGEFNSGFSIGFNSSIAAAVAREALPMALGLDIQDPPAVPRQSNGLDAKRLRKTH